MKIETSKRHDARGRIIGYVAQVGDIYADGETAAEAKAALEPKILAACTWHEPSISSVAGHYIVVCSADGTIWGYRILGRPNESPQIEYGGRGASCIGYDSADTALRAARRDLATSSGTLEDALMIADSADHSEVTRYMEWQRKYREAVNLGYGSEDARRIAEGWPVGWTTAMPGPPPRRLSLVGLRLLSLPCRGVIATTGNEGQPKLGG